MRPHITGSRSLRVQTDIGRPIAVSVGPKTDIPVNGRFAPEPAGRGCTVQLLPGHTKLEGTVQCLRIETDDALNLTEQIKL